MAAPEDSAADLVSTVLPDPAQRPLRRRVVSLVCLLIALGSPSALADDEGRPPLYRVTATRVRLRAGAPVTLAERNVIRLTSEPEAWIVEGVVRDRTGRAPWWYRVHNVMTGERGVIAGQYLEEAEPLPHEMLVSSPAIRQAEPTTAGDFTPPWGVLLIVALMAMVGSIFRALRYYWLLQTQKWAYRIERLKFERERLEFARSMGWRPNWSYSPYDGADPPPPSAPVIVQ